MDIQPFSNFSGKLITMGGTELVVSWSGGRLMVALATPIQQVVKVETTTLDDINTSNVPRFYIHTPFKSFYVWYEIDNYNINPREMDKFDIKVSVNSTDTDTQIATKTANAINVHTDFTASSSTNEVTITCVAGGECDEPSDKSTGFTIITDTLGKSEIYDGFPFEDVVKILDVNIGSDGSATFACLKQVTVHRENRPDRWNYSRTTFIPVKKSKGSGFISI